MPYIYVITNDINKKQYVGKTLETISERFRQHIKDRHHFMHRPLYHAMNKYGPEHFSVMEQEECSVECVNDREIFWIEKLGTFKNGYNATVGGDGKHYLDYEVLVEAYRECGTLVAAAEKLGVCPDSIKKALSIYGIELPSTKEIATIALGKPTVMMDSDDNVLRRFDSLRDAARYLVDDLKATKSYRAANMHIAEVCKNKRKSAYGYHWKYE